MAQGTITARIQLLDEDGNVIGGADMPMEVDSSALQDSIDALSEKIDELKDTIALVFG